MNSRPPIDIDSALKAVSSDFRVMDLEIPDCPVFLSVAVPAPGSSGLKPRLPAGRGLTRNRARLSAAGEAAELMASLARSHAPPAATGCDDEGRALLRLEPLAGGPPLSTPAQRIWLDHAAVHGEAALCDATSAGCAARFTRDEAVTAALLELIERDALSAWWHGGHARARLDVDLVARAEPRFADWLAGRTRRTSLIDISTDIPVAAIAAVSHDESGKRVAVGTAAGFSPAAAALSALTEMVQTEVAMDLAAPAQPPELAAWLAVADIQSMAQFQPGGGVAQSAFAAGTGSLAAAMAGLGYPAYVYVYPQNAEPFVTSRAVCPGLTAMGAPDAARIGRLRERLGWLYPPERASRFEDIEPF